ncbi:hypothetical protein AKJ50_00455, partial [candidate division MSBL1 archaeon SCGC-AAA382A13]
GSDEEVEIEDIDEAIDYIRTNVPEEIAEQIIDAIRSVRKESFPEYYLNLECRRCGHEWTVRKVLKPKDCSECESPRLDQEKQKPNTDSLGTPEEDIDEDGKLNP